MRRILSPLTVALLVVASAWAQVDKTVITPKTHQSATSVVISLDGDQWLLKTDPKNVGVSRRWFDAPHPDAKETRVPWTIQDALPGYHGVAWYWRDLDSPGNIHAEGRSLLRSWAVDYKAEVWLNGIRIGGHEGGETPFQYAPPCGGTARIVTKR